MLFPLLQRMKLIVHHNKQRVKTCKELLNEVSVLLPGLEVGKGKRTYLTSVSENTAVKATSSSFI